MKFKLGQKVKIGGVNGTVIACIGSTFDIRIEDGSVILARGELLTDDQPEVKIERLDKLQVRCVEGYASPTIYEQELYITVNKLIDFCNTHNSKEYRKIDYGKLRDLAGKISDKEYGDEPKEDWEERFEEEFGKWFYSPEYQGYVKLRNVTKDFIRNLLGEKE